MKEKLFVYGTLRKGKTRLDYIKGKLWDLGRFPGLVLEGNTNVTGEIIEVDEPTLAELDLYEGVPQGLYRRARQNTKNGEEVWVYLFNRDIPDYAKEIITGDWFNKLGVLNG
jgi:gamma-glutamylcyclotransferase (GGCT)/AIG2-like uncharacterized protein YtfP